MIRRLRFFWRALNVCSIEVSVRALLIFLLFAVLNAAAIECSGAPLPRMRPYVGIGLVVFKTPDRDLQLQLYEEPGLSRVGMLDSSRISGNEWVFGLPDAHLPLVVSARKGDWLQVYYDDAGREAWIDPQSKGRFQTWEQYLKMQTGHMLSGLQPQYYQFLQKPGGKLLATLTPRQVFKVLKLANSWGMVLTDQGQIGWVRWCDDDGRLLIGTGRN